MPDEIKRGPGRPPKAETSAIPGTIKMVILRDYWGDENPDGTENRYRAGTIVDMPIEAAMDGIEAGMVERYKGE